MGHSQQLMRPTPERGRPTNAAINGQYTCVAEPLTPPTRLLLRVADPLCQTFVLQVPAAHTSPQVSPFPQSTC